MFLDSLIDYHGDGPGMSLIMARPCMVGCFESVREPDSLAEWLRTKLVRNTFWFTT